MGEHRQRYKAFVRQRAFEMAVYEGVEDITEIAQQLKINESTLKRWRSEDRWEDAKHEGSSASFVNIRNNLMLVIHRLVQRLVESMMGDSLPDENIELRIDRLTRSLERTAPMGTFLLTKQRLDVVAEIQQCGVEALENQIITEEDLRNSFKVLKIYAASVKDDRRRGNPIAA